MLKKVGDFTAHRLLGAGAFGEVYLVSDKDGRQFAAKTMRITPGNIISQIKEAILQIDLDYKHLLRAHEAFLLKDIGLFVILLDYCEQGSLAEFIGKLHAKGNEATQKMMLEISRGVKYLHKNKTIIHRDLKPENILIKNGHPKISDYGLSKILQGKADTCCGTPLYMS